MNQFLRGGTGLVLVAALGYSFFSIFTKFIYENGVTSPLDVLLWRFALAVPIIWLTIRFLPRPSALRPLPWQRLFSMGLLFGVVAMSAFFALQRLPVALYTVLIYTYPTMVALGSLLFGERLSGLGWLSLGLTLVGVALTVPNLFTGLTGIDPFGVLLVFINAVSYATYILLSGRILRGVDDLARASAWSMTGSLIFALIAAAVLSQTPVGGASLPPNLNAWLGLAGLAVVATVIPIFAFYAGMKSIGSAQAAIISMIEPVLTLIWAWLLRGEGLTSLQLLGGFFILGSVFMLQVSAIKPADPQRVRPTLAEDAS